jgi:SPOR domain
MRRLLPIALLVLLLVPSAAGAHNGLPLGSGRLEESRSTDVLAPGVTYTRIVRGELSASDGWTADVAIVAARAEADDLAQRLRAAGFDAHVTELPGPPDAQSRGAFAYRVRSGLFGRRAQADERVAEIRAASLPARGSVFTAEDGGPTSGPWVLHVLSVDPDRYRGRVAPTLANDVVADRETLSSLSARKGALAGINGGYFVIGEADGTPGDLAGSSILDGRVVSEAVDGRTDLVLGRRGPLVSALSDSQWVTASDGATACWTAMIASPG